jgi:hypothetical protein
MLNYVCEIVDITQLSKMLELWNFVMVGTAQQTHQVEIFLSLCCMHCSLGLLIRVTKEN